MSPTMLQLALLVASVAGVTTGLVVLRPARPHPLAPVRAAVPRPSSTAIHPLPLDSLARAAAARAPFRATRTLPAVAYDPDRSFAVGGPPVPPPAPKPALTLTGIASDGGAAGAAVLEGLPGTDGPRAVRAGETVAGIRVRRIQRDRVVVTGFDTTWTLTVRVPWR